MVIKKEEKMKLNPYSILLILSFSIITSVTNKTIKNKEYEKTTNDSSFYPIDSIGFERQMWLEHIETPAVEWT